jgi:HAMP domain-containing protein
MYIVKCDTCATKYKIADLSLINDIDARYHCKRCGQNFGIAEQLYQIKESRDIFSSKKSKNNVEKQPHLIPNAGRINPSKDSVGLNKSKFETLKKFTLWKKFNIAMGCMMIVSMVIIFFISDYISKKGAEKQVLGDARLLLTMIEASRDFTSKVLKPVLFKALPGRFVVEGMSSSFGARNIFERIKEKYPEYYFKHASLNPRNKLNLADETERDIIQNHFKPNHQSKEWTGYRDFNGRKDFIIMKPIIAEKRCMKCHSVPEKAPQEVIERYGDKAAFGMVEDEVIGALSLSVPATEILSKARHDTIVVNLIVFACFIAVIFIINIFFQQIVIIPIRKLSKLINDISVGKTNRKITVQGNDELKDLAKSFERMRMSINLGILKRNGK